MLQRQGKLREVKTSSVGSLPESGVLPNTNRYKKDIVLPNVKNYSKHCSFSFGKTPKQSGVAGLQSLGIHLAHT